MKIPSSKSISFCVISFMAGITAFSFLLNNKAVLLFFLILLFFFLFLFENQRKIILVLILFFLAGTIRTYFFELDFKDSPLNNFYDQEIILTAKIVKEPDVREKNTRLIVGDIKIGNNYFKKERIIIFSNQYLDVGQNDILEVKGKISKPESFDGFDYEGYLKTYGVGAIIFYPKIKTLEEGSSFIFSLKEKMRQVLYKNISFPESTILGAMILGDKGRIPDTWLSKLSSTGVRHITAVSGMHIVIISSILMSIFSEMDRKISFPLIIAFLFFFIFLTGFQSSAIRAGLISLSIFISKIIGRENFSLRIIFLIAFLMLMINPNLLLHDIGFQLSFLSFFGISILSEKIKETISFLPPIFSSSISVTTSAFIFSFPMVIYYFKEAPMMFLPTNLVLSLIIYPIMFLGIIFLVLSHISYPLSCFFLFPLRILMNLFTKTVDFFFDLSKISSNSIDLKITEMIILYSILFLFCYLYGKKEQNKLELTNDF